LSAFEIGGMTGIGLVEARHQFYVIESINNTNPVPFVSANLKSLTGSGSGHSSAHKEVNVDANQNHEVSFPSETQFVHC
jgi:hypothetical protein